MADTASLITRVKNEGVAQAATELDKLAQSAAKADTATSKLPKGMSEAEKAAARTANSIKNASYQFQDFIVQVSSGQNGLMAFSQQAPQLLSSFGTVGAVVGVIAALASAVGGPLVKAMTDSRASADEMKAAHETLAKALEQTQSGAYQASDALMQLIASGASAQEQSAVLDSAQQALNKTIKDSAQAAQEATQATNDWYYGNAIGAKSAMDLGQQTSSLAGFLDNLSSKFGISADEAQRLTPLLAAVQKEATPTNIKALADETARLVTAHGNQNEALVTLNGSLQQYATNSRNAQAAQEALKKAQEDATRRINEQNNAVIENLRISNMADRDRIAAQADADKKAFAQRQNVTKEQIDEYNRQRDEASRQDIAAIDKREKDKADAEAKAGAARSAAAAARTESESQRQQKAADDFLKQVERTSGDEIARINATEQQKLETLNKFRDINKISDEEYEKAKTDIQLTAEDARQKELEKRQQDQAKKQGQHDQYLADIEALNASELELIDAQQTAREAKAKEFRDRGIINEEEYQKALAAIADQADKKRLDSYEGTLSDTTSALKTALGEGSALYKAAAITQTIIETYKGATAAYASLATIPIIGPGLGIAAAAAITAAGLANVAKIRSAREQGGQLSPGQVSTIAERGQPEVIMPAGASRVRTANQMRQIMGENTSSGVPQISIINQTTGRVDEVQQRQDDEGRITLLIREVVSGDLQDSNSRIAKSRKISRGQPGMS